MIPDKSRSKCRFLYCLNGRKVYIVDLGLDCVFVLSLRETIVRTFGCTGKRNGEFSDPAGLAADFFGNTIIADSRNHRLQVSSQMIMLGAKIQILVQFCSFYDKKMKLIFQCFLSDFISFLQGF